MAYKPTASKKNRRKMEGGLNMNSMMDMVTIILLFLLKSYSTEGALKNAANDLKLPESYRMIKPVKAVTVTISQSVIMVDKTIVLEIDKVGEDQFIKEAADELKKFREAARKAEEIGVEFKNEVLLVMDKGVPFDLLSKIVYTCGQSDFYNIRMMVQGFGLDLK